MGVVRQAPAHMGTAVRVWQESKWQGLKVRRGIRQRSPVSASIGVIHFCEMQLKDCLVAARAEASRTKDAGDDGIGDGEDWLYSGDTAERSLRYTRSGSQEVPSGYLEKSRFTSLAECDAVQRCGGVHIIAIDK